MGREAVPASLSSAALAPFRRGRLELAPVVAALARDGATSVPLLAEPFRLALLDEAMRRTYRPARAVVGQGDRVVHQRMGYCPEFPPESGFHVLTARFQALFDAALAALPERPFSERPVFNDLMLQRYEVGRLGITPHLDRTAYRHVVCLFVLAGRARFGVSADRGGRDPLLVANAPGDVLLLRAPGFLPAEGRPFHFVEDIEETRYVFGLRHLNPGGGDGGG